MEMNLSLPAPTSPSEPSIFPVVPFSLVSGVICVYVHLSSVLDPKLERQIRCILYLSMVGSTSAC